MQQQAQEDFAELAKSFRKSGLYEGMRESNMELADDFPPELAMELGGGRPIWFSTCDQNLLIYSVMCNRDEVPHSQAAFTFLKEATRTIDSLVPQLKHDHDVVTSIQGQAGNAVRALLDESQSQAASTNDERQSVASFGVSGGNGNTKLDAAHAKVAGVQGIMQANVQKMINIQNDLGDIEARAGDIKNIAFNVRNNADQLRREAVKRNQRIMVIMGLFGAAILVYIILGSLQVGQSNR